MNHLEETPYFTGGALDWRHVIGAQAFHNSMASGRRMANGTWSLHLNVPMVMHGQVWDSMAARAVVDDFGALVVLPDPSNPTRPNIQ